MNIKVNKKAFIFSLLITLGFSANSQEVVVPGGTPVEFAVANGAPNISIPLSIPEGKAGMQPDLSLVYSGGAVNGVLGQGWAFTGVSVIHRCPANMAIDGFISGINFDSSDRYCVDGQRLIPVNGVNGGVGTEYRTEIDGYARVKSQGGTANNPSSFLVYTKSGQIIHYGGASTSRLSIHNKGTFQWSTSSVKDTSGNTIYYKYDIQELNQYLNEINYNGGSVKVNYENRPDVSNLKLLGSNKKVSKRVSSIEIYSASSLWKTYKLTYENPSLANISRLINIKECASSGSLIHCKNPVTFNWKNNDAPLNFGDKVTNAIPYTDILANLKNRNEIELHNRDWNGDGLQDFFLYNKATGKNIFYLSTGDRQYTRHEDLLPSSASSSTSPTIVNKNVLIGDWNGDGAPDLMFWTGAGQNVWFVNNNAGSLGFTTYQNKINPSDAPWGMFISGDLNGDSIDDIIYYAGGGANNWFINDGSLNFTVKYNLISPSGIDGGNLILGDWNGDTLTDVLFYRIDGTNRWFVNNGAVTSNKNNLNFRHYSSLISPGGFDGGTPRTGDWNSDGLTDILLYRNSGTNRWYTNNGDMTYTNSGLDPIWDGDITSGGIYLEDFNADGLNDLGFYKDSGSNIFFLRKDDGSFERNASVVNANAIEDGLKNLFGDWNGDGFTDFLFIQRSGANHWYLNQGREATLIDSFFDSNGNLTEIKYKLLTDPSVYQKGDGAQYPLQDVIGTTPVVSEVITQDGVGGTANVQYFYQGYKAHVGGRGSYGYASITEKHIKTGKVTETFFNQSGFPLAGRVDRTVESYNGQVLNESFNTFSSTKNSSGIYKVYQSRSLQRSYELNGQLITEVETLQSSVDEYGNIGRIDVHTRGGGETYTQSTVSTYSDDVENWFLGRLTESTTTHTSPTGVQRRKAQFTYSVEDGLLKTETIVGADTGQILNTKEYWNIQGLPIATYLKSSAMGTRQLNYNQYVHDGFNPTGKLEKKCNTFGECDTYQYNTFGVVQSITDRNGLQTSFEYDLFGRKTHDYFPDGTQATTQLYFADHEACGELIETAYTCVVTQTTGTKPSITQLDVLGREVRKISQSFDDRQAFADIEYDAWGRVARASREYFAGNQIYWMTSEYDALDRVVKITEPGPHGSTNEIVTDYQGLTTVVTGGPDARQKRTTNNAIGQVAEVEEESGVITRYTYDADGNILTTIVNDDPATKITFTYDEFGRKVAMDDPDMGHWSYVYNDFGELTSQTDAKGQTTAMYYDNLGRMTRRIEVGAVSTWVYGQKDDNPGEVGKLLEVTGGGITKQYSYDSLGRIVATTEIISGEGSFTTHTDYDLLGRVSRVTYPGTQGFYTENIYNENGYLERVRGLRSQAQMHDLNALLPLIQSATTISSDYLQKANKLRDLGNYYQQRINDYSALIANQVIQFEQGTTAGLEPNKAYQFLAAGNNTYYIQVPDKFVPIAGDIMVPILLPPEYHYRVVDDGTTQTISQITPAEFAAVQNTLTDVGDKIYVLNNNTITCACESVGHANYVANLQAHQALLQEWVIEGNGLAPEFLNHLNNTVIELQEVQSLLSQQAAAYSSTASQLALLAEQTLAAADHSYQIVDTLQSGSSAYADMMADNDYITYWRAVDVDASGRVSAEVYGNGVVNDLAYNQATGQLQAIHTSLLSLGAMRHLEYQYDAYNNVTLRDDLVNDIHESFTYDRLDRLISTNVNSTKYQTAEFNTIQSVDYDAFGRITYKSDVGGYSYGTTKPHAVLAAGGATYRYDANGNMTHGDGRTIGWNANNKAVSMTKDGRTVFFSYGADRSRYKKVNDSGDTTLYVGGLYEKVTRGSDVEQRHYVMAAGQIVAEHILSTSNGTQTRYLHKDALGSIDLITDAYANVVDRRSFDAWGKLRDLPWRAEATLSDPLYLSQLPFTDKGYTGHESIQEVGLIHMNGRIYDAVLARFLSADPIIQSPTSSQNYDRYSYVMNNPLKYTDPSGYSFKRLFRALKQLWNHVRPVVGAVVAIVIGFYCGATCAAPIYAAFVGAVTGFIQAAANGGDVGKAVLLGALSGYLFSHVGGAEWLTDGTTRVLAHAVVGGVMSVLQGGKFGRGFISAGFAKFASNKLFGNKSDIDTSGSAVAGRTTVAALVGGTASKLGGGKFGNGAATAALAHLVNMEGEIKRAQKEKSIYQIGMELTEPYVSMYDKNDPNYHDYGISSGIPTLACMIGDGSCSVANVALIVDQEAVPLMSNPGNGSHDILGTNPIVHFSPTDTVSINETRVGHWFHPGRVVHVTFEHKGGVYLFTRGAGIGPDPGWNKAIGGLLFGKMHADVMNRTRDELLK